MVLNAAAQMLRGAEELKQKILKFKSGTSMLQERSLWTTQQQLQKIYQKVLVLDLDYALDKKVEQDLWNVGFKQQIEALQAISKDRKNALRSEGQAMLAWVLQAAAGFYLCLLHQICSTFRLDLPFRRRASLLGWVEGWGACSGEGTTGAKLPPPAAARYICQHCLVHLGDLARYRQQLRIAHTFYRHALLVSAHSGQPYNQLALVAWRRARPLSALYWHVRSLLVRAPFPPAPANLTRTLAAAAATAAQRNRDPEKDLPVLPGVTRKPSDVTAQATPARLDAHNYVGELIRALHLIHTLDESESVNQLVSNLNSSLTALVATDSFDSMTLVKMACVCMWLAHWSTEGHTVAADALSASERAAMRSALSLCAGALLAMVLPAYTRAEPPHVALPALKVWLQWLCSRPHLLSDAALASRPQIWPALAHTLNALAVYSKGLNAQLYETLPLPEDEELHGFLPLEGAFVGLKFSNYAAWDTYGDRIPDFRPEGGAADAAAAPEDGGQAVLENIRSPSEMTEENLRAEPELERRVRARRLVALGAALAAHVARAGCDYFTVKYAHATNKVPYTLSSPANYEKFHASLNSERGLNSTDGEVAAFSSSACGGDVLSRAIAELAQAAANGTTTGRAEDAERDSDEDSTPATPPKCRPLIISEADFKEKVREKRVGILKPQGSLERAREERALATTSQQDTEDADEGSSKAEEVRARETARRPRMNVAMAAIMRKQEEINKQVKFVTPATTPDSPTDSAEAKTTKEPSQLKIIQPKPTKSLSNLPIGRKTGGILSLKDKSAGYPHLVNAEPEPVKQKPEKEDKKHETAKPNQGTTQGFQQVNYSPVKPRENPTSPNIINAPSGLTPNPYNDAKLNFQVHKNTYTPQNPLNFNYPNPTQGQGIKLAVVNPKEIDVRSAALLKQNSRQELFHDGQKFNQNYHLSSDKKNFLNDLPPRFANQYRYWQHSDQYPQENKFRDDSLKNSANSGIFANTPSRPNWPVNQENYQQPTDWWPPNNNYNVNYTSPMNLQQNYYSNSYQNVPYSMHNQPVQKPEVNPPQNYMQTGNQPLQGLAPSRNFTPLNSFGNYNQPVGYDSNMFQFGGEKLGFQPQIKMPEKPIGHSQNDLNMRPSFNYDGGRLNEMHQPDHIHADINSTNNLDHMGLPEPASSSYSLFSGAPEPASWAARPNPQQSLWSGPMLSPLQRLLEQQKQMKQQPGDN